jgi:hypothetical protein
MPMISMDIDDTPPWYLIRQYLIRRSRVGPRPASRHRFRQSNIPALILSIKSIELIGI